MTLPKAPPGTVNKEETGIGDDNPIFGLPKNLRTELYQKLIAELSVLRSGLGGVETSVDQLTSYIDGRVRDTLQRLLELAGIDPDVARAMRTGELLGDTREVVSISFIDMSGYTDICGKFGALGQNPKIKKLASNFLTFVYDRLKTFGGMRYKTIGDCVVSLYGPPFLKNGKDAYGLDAEKRNPEVYAMNAFKAFLKVQRELKGELREKYHTLLYEIARERYGADASTDRNELIGRLMEQYHLKPDLDVSAGITTTESNVGLVEIGGGQSEYGIFDTGINQTARLQGIAATGELLVGPKTKEYIEKLRESDEPVPLSSGGKSQTWREFCEQELGVDFMKEEFEISFEQTFVFARNVRGPIVAYRVKVQRSLKSDIEAESRKPIDNFDDLMKTQGEYDAITPPNKKNTTVKYTLRRRIHGRSQEFTMEIPRERISSKKIIYVSEEDLRNRRDEDRDHKLIIWNGKITEVEYESVELKLRDDLGITMRGKEEATMSHQELPVGMYEVMDFGKDPYDNECDAFNLRRGMYTVSVKIPRDRVSDDPKSIAGDEEFKFHYDNHVSFMKKREGIWPRPKHYIYMAGNNNYLLLDTAPEAVAA